VVISDLERDAILATIAELEGMANTQPEHTTTRAQLFRIAADLRRQFKGAIVTNTYRGKPVKKDV
jgi:hypothetical protein